MNQKRRHCIFSYICMTPRISQALYGCQVGAVLTHRNLRTQLRNQWEEASVDLREGEEEGRKQAGIPFSHRPSASNVWWSGNHTARSWKHLYVVQGDFVVTGAGLVMHGLVWWFFFFYLLFLFFCSSRPIHLSASWSREHNLCKETSFGEKPKYSRSSQLTLTLVSEIVLLLLQVTPKIAT